MKKEIISTDKAPAAIGPYVQATKLGEMLFTSGVIPVRFQAALRSRQDRLFLLLRLWLKLQALLSKRL